MVGPDFKGGETGSTSWWEGILSPTTKGVEPAGGRGSGPFLPSAFHSFSLNGQDKQALCFALEENAVSTL